MKKSQMHELECALFWQISGELLQAAKEHGPQQLIDDDLDELEGLRVNTDQVTLRKRCVDLAAQFRVAESASGQSG